MEENSVLLNLYFNKRASASVVGGHLRIAAEGQCCSVLTRGSGRITSCSIGLAYNEVMSFYYWALYPDMTYWPPVQSSVSSIKLAISWRALRAQDFIIVWIWTFSYNILVPRAFELWYIIFNLFCLDIVFNCSQYWSYFELPTYNIQPGAHVYKSFMNGDGPFQGE